MKLKMFWAGQGEIELWAICQLLAQAEIPNPIAGKEGWVTAIANGAVLAWYLFIRVPATDKLLREKDEAIAKFQEDQKSYIKDIIAGCDKHNIDVLQRFTDQLTQARQHFLEQYSQQREHYINQGKQQQEIFERSLQLIISQSEKNVVIMAEAVRQEMQQGKNNLHG